MFSFPPSSQCSVSFPFFSLLSVSFRPFHLLSFSLHFFTPSLFLSHPLPSLSCSLPLISPSSFAYIPPTVPPPSLRLLLFMLPPGPSQFPVFLSRALLSVPCLSPSSSSHLLTHSPTFPSPTNRTPDFLTKAREYHYCIYYTWVRQRFYPRQELIKWPASFSNVLCTRA